MPRAGEARERTGEAGGHGLESLLDPYLETLCRVTEGLSPRRPFQGALREMLAALAEHLHFQRPHIVVLDPESGNLRLSLAYGREAGDQGAADAAYAPGTGVTGQVFSSGSACIVERMADHPEFRNRLFGRSRQEMENLAFLCVPVRSGSGYGSGALPSSGQGPARGEDAAGDAAEIIGTLSADTPLAPPAVLRLRCRFLEAVALLVGRQVAYLQEEMARQHFQSESDSVELPDMPTIVSVSKSMRGVLAQAAKVGPSRATALLRGESGTGKELLAEAIHRFSPRRDKPFVRLNCAALPADLVEGELFGWNRGAFTGARDHHRGLFEQADTGTLFLDEIGDLSLPAQAKVLRAIQDREIRNLGGERSVPVDVRLICATHQPLEQLVEEGRFRADLYYRINVFPMFIPPLRERRDDILPLCDYFLGIFAAEYKRPVRRVSTPAIDLLLQYHWPGNIRELKNVLERAVLVCDEAVIRAHHLSLSLQTAGSSDTLDALRLGFTETVAKVEQELLVDALKHARGNIHQAARDLRVTYRIFQYKLKKYAIDYRRFILPGQAGSRG
ncbi:MAG: sigma 54-interacting transcriptional regulator [Desulfovibrionaceae bacterium]|nr:sigma 54-interacting transcriptional regulator [Desulfovibrionaceae bacterium]